MHEAFGRSLAALILACGLASVRARAAEAVSPMEAFDAGSELAERVQKKVLDPVLGAGRSSAFAEVRLECERSVSEKSKLGRGQTATEKKEASQYAEQAHSEAGSLETLSARIVGLRLRVLYDETLPKERLAAVKKALLALFKDSMKPEALELLPVAFEGKRAD